MSTKIKNTFRRMAAILLAAVLAVQFIPAPSAEAAEEDLTAIVEKQIRAFADSIDKSGAADDAAWALAKHGIGGSGKKLSVGKSHALTATLFNSEMMQIALTETCSEAIRSMQHLDLSEMNYIHGTVNFYDSSTYRLSIYTSDALDFKSTDRRLAFAQPYSGKKNTYDNELKWMAGGTYCDIDITRSKSTATQSTYKVTCTITDRFDFSISNGSGFKDLISGIAALFFKEFDWVSTVSFNLTVPYSCNHSYGMYHWVYDAETKGFHSDSTGSCTENPCTRYNRTSSSANAGSFYYELDETVRLYHNKPWVLEYDIKDPNCFVLAPHATLSISEPAIMNCEFDHLSFILNENDWATTSDMEQYGLSSHNQIARQYYGTKLDALFTYNTNQIYRIRLENKLNTDGSNMVYLTAKNAYTGELLLDNVAMNDYYRYELWSKNGILKSKSSKWVNGKDIFINYIGNKDFPFSTDHFELRIWENGKDGENESYYTSKVTKPTCTAGGYTTYTCAACGYSYTGNKTSAKGHSYKSKVTAPTCTAEGYTTHSCSCGDSYTTDRIAPQGHDYFAGLCTVCSEDSVSASLAENILSLTGELAEGTRILAACYDSDGQLSDVKILVWHGEPIAEEIPLEKTVKLFLVDANWSPLRKFIPLR